ncbi:putative secreted protein (Por secretion system target) [Larkinella arboricola]|uniref:Putative secreted protein (Por secretion system target) n=1 Tax=Larkinella arboricola TaxID=643671 RepID=A0A327X4K0_LARAB|nr:M43 family zinc metalloprotease [Larkinella arboricola]RAK00465.1 putative secreted protein (Por secretion system target) [Larkinella arboricola]
MNGLKNKPLLAAVGLWLSLGLGEVRAQTPGLPQRCGIDQREIILQQRDPQRLARRQKLNEQIQEVISRQKKEAQTARVGEVIYRIPVVVHVVHNNSSGFIGGANNPNISDEQIASQIQVLNEDYRRLPKTRGFNTNPIGADTGIEFFLARVDPDGFQTNGITRHYSEKSTFNVYDGTSGDDVALSQIAYWPSDKYLNIWVTSLRNDYLGYSQFPEAENIPGLNPTENELTDGVIIDYRYFGSDIGAVTSSIYRYGRTTTHEVGHWLGLLHTWGDDYCGNDYCNDTPPTEGANQTTECVDKFSNCNGTRTRNLIENYLDYTPDACMNLFTLDQKARMRAVIEASPRRQRLVKSTDPLPQTEKLTVNVFPNPTDKSSTLEVLFTGFQSFQVDLVDASGRIIRSQKYTEYPSSSITLPVETLNRGIYFVKVRTDKETASQRLLIH